MNQGQTNLFPNLKPGKVLCFGELLLRFSPDINGNWLRENQLHFNVGGAEANVATALALWDIPTAYFTAIPDNEVSEQLAQYLQNKQIDTSTVVFQGDRLGVFYLPHGKDMKNAGVIYDRSGSSFCNLKPETIDWDAVFQGVSWLHFSAICPAVSQSVADVCEEALSVAVKKGVKISLDLNYRAKLWQYGKTPLEIIPQLANYCDLIMGNLWAAEKMLGVPVDAALKEDSNMSDYLAHAAKTSTAIAQLYPKVKAIANTFRFDQGEQSLRYYTTLFADDVLSSSTVYETVKIVDKVGSGDCFMAGLLYGFYEGLPVRETLEFATAAGFQKLLIAGDITTDKVEDIQAFLKAYGR